MPIKMWFPNDPPDAADPWPQAVAFLRKADPKMKQAIDLVGPCMLRPRRDYFVVLCKSVVSQQVSTAAAATIFGRFRELFPSRRPTPARVVDLMRADLERMRRCGFSRQKLSYI